MSNTPNEGQPGSEPQPGAWGQSDQPPADAAQAPGTPSWGAPSGYGAPEAAAPAASAPATQGSWDLPPTPAQPGTQGNGWQQAAHQAGWDAPQAARGAGAPAVGGSAPGWDRSSAQQGYGTPASGGYPAPGTPATSGAPNGYAANYAVPASLQSGLHGAINPDDLTRPLYGATFGQALKRLFRNYVNFSGRASRSEFWWVMLAMFLLQLIPSILYSIGAGQVAVATLANTDSHGIVDSRAVAASAGGAVALMGLGGALIGVIGLGLLLPLLGLFWRRLHDGNFSGLFFLLCLVPGVGALVVLILCALESKPEGRRFDVAPGYAAY